MFTEFNKNMSRIVIWILNASFIIQYLCLKLSTVVLPSPLHTVSLSVRQEDSSTVWFAGLVIEVFGSLGKVLLYAGSLHMVITHGMFQSQLVKVNSFTIK